MNNPLLMGKTELDALSGLRARAAADPVDVREVVEQIKTPEGKAQHMRRMGGLTIDIPLAYEVTFTIEIGHPSGTFRHMSISSGITGRVPIQEAVWMVARELGFVGGLERCRIYPEKLIRTDGEAVAINVLQPLAMADEHADR